MIVEAKLAENAGLIEFEAVHVGLGIVEREATCVQGWAYGSAGGEYVR